jgi:mono/diheme cytochrome c family protein
LFGCSQDAGAVEVERTHDTNLGQGGLIVFLSQPPPRLSWPIRAGALLMIALIAGSTHFVQPLGAQPPGPIKRHRHLFGRAHCDACHAPPVSDVGGSWFWMRTPDDEKRVVISLYTRYCIRCHGIDGRGVWDIPGVPDFTNQRFQESIPDPHIVNSIIEGRGACMPPFRGTLTLEEAWAMARYLRTFVPGTEVSKPDFGRAPGSPLSAPAGTSSAPAAMTPPLPAAENRSPFAR